MKFGGKLIVAVLAMVLLCGICLVGCGGPKIGYSSQGKPDYDEKDGLLYMPTENGTYCLAGRDQGFECREIDGRATLVIPSYIDGCAVTEIKNYAFYNCDFIEVVVIPYTISRIGTDAFQGCTRLSEIIYQGDEVAWSKVSAARAFPDSSTIVCSRKTMGLDYVMTSYYDDHGEMMQGWYVAGIGIAFDEETIRIPQEYRGSPVIGIKQNAFRNCLNIKTVVIPPSVTEIDTCAFFGCTNLENVFMSPNVTRIGDYAFNDCRQLEYIFTDEWSETFVFSGLSEEEVVRTIGLPQELREIGAYAFTNCERLQLQHMIAPANMASIGNGAFAGCKSLLAAVITGEIDVLSQNIFEGCDRLEEVYIPASVREIQDCAFSGCHALSDIIYDGTCAEWLSVTFSSSWNDDTGDYTVRCTDGVLRKS